MWLKNGGLALSNYDYVLKALYLDSSSHSCLDRLDDACRQSKSVRECDMVWMSALGHVPMLKVSTIAQKLNVIFDMPVKLLIDYVQTYFFNEK